MSQKKQVLVIKVNNSSVGLELVKEGKVVDQRKWEDIENTSTKLLKEIDSFLAENELTIQDIKRVEAKIDKKQKFTLARIVKIVVATLNYSLNGK